MSLHYRDIQNQSTGSFNDLNADNIEIGNVSSDTIQTDAITGKSNINQLALLSNTITNTNTGHLSTLNQNVATTASPQFVAVSTDTITGKSNANQLALLGSTITNANAIYLSLMNQHVYNGASPNFQNLGLTGLIDMEDDLSHSKYIFIRNLNAGTLTGIYLDFPQNLATDTKFVLENVSQPLTNKQFNCDLNTLTNLSDNEIKLLAGIDPTKISQGLVNGVSFDFLANLDQFLSTSSSPTFTSITIKDINETNTITLYCPWNLSGNAAASIPQALQGLDDEIIFKTLAQALTNKTLDADLNTLSNIKNAEIKAGANIDPNKIQYLKKSVNNYAFGDLALNSVSTALGCVAIGFEALKTASNTNNNYCTAIGYESLEMNSGGKENTGVGVDSLLFNTSGDYNTAMGGFAGFLNTTSSQSCFFGYYAGYNSTGGNNVIIGVAADVSPASNNNCVVIGKSALGTTSNSITIGTTLHTTFKCPCTSFNTAGIVISSGSTTSLLSSTTTITPQITFTAGIKTDTIDERTATNGVNIDNLLIKDGAIRFLEASSNPITTDAEHSTLWVKNSANSSLYLNNSGGSDKLLFGVRGCLYNNNSTNFIVNTGGDITGLYLGASNTSLYNTTRIVGQIYTITSVSSGTGGLARFNHAGSAIVIGRPTTISVSNYTNGIYTVLNSGTGWMEFAGVIFGITGTGKIYQPDILEVGISGHITLNFTADLSSPTVGLIVESWIWQHNAGANNGTFGYSHNTIQTANYTQNINSQIQFVCTGGDQYFIIIKTDTADTLTFKKFLLSVWC